MECECEFGELCKRFKRVLDETEHRICSGEAFDPETTAKYHGHWARLAAVNENTRQQAEKANELAAVRQATAESERDARIVRINREARDRVVNHREHAESCKWRGELKGQKKCNTGCRATGWGKPFDVFHCLAEEVINQFAGECSVHPKHTKVQWCFGCDFYEKG